MANAASEDVVRVAESLRLLQKHLECMICLEMLQNPVSTRCGHSFCNMCVDHLFTGKKTALCPLCNTSVTRRGVVVNEKIKLLVKCARGVITAAQKDIADIGFRDIMEVERKQKSSTHEALSPTGQGLADAVRSSASKKSSKVESWLSEMPPPTLTQESTQSVHVDISPNEDSDGELVSVSQFKPNQGEKKISIEKSKPLSACIEEDRDANSDESLDKKDISKQKKLLKPHDPRQGPSAKSKSIQELQTSVLKQSKLSTKFCSVSKKKEYSGGPVPDPVIVLFDGEKENTSNPPLTRSPGWSRINRIKKDFAQQPKVLRTVNSKGNSSPAPSIEDAGSADEEPCLNLSLDSPVLKNKAKVNEIVNNLESEIQIIEKSGQDQSAKVERMKVQEVEKQSNARTSLFKSVTEGGGFSGEGTMVKFLKLGSIVSRKTPSVPIYLKGSLEHLDGIRIVNIPHRVFVDAQTQTSTEYVQEYTSCPTTRPYSAADNASIPISPVKNISPKHRRSADRNSDCDMDTMDAETVLLSQLPSSKHVWEQKTYSPEAELNEEPVLDNDGIDNDGKVLSQHSESIIFSQIIRRSPTKTASALNSPFLGNDGTDNHGKVLSQQSESIIFSQIIRRSPAKIASSALQSPAIPEVDLDESSSSSINEHKSKRTRTLPCSSDSSDTDIEVSKKQAKKRKKTKTQVLSDSEDNSLPEIGLLDTSLPDPESRAKIKAKIEAALKDTEGSQSPEWDNPNTEKLSTNQSLHNPDDLDVLFDESRTQIDSDADSEVINPTPQKQSSFISRNITQSDDIVPSSQPPIADHKSPASLLQNLQRDEPTKVTSSIEKSFKDFTQVESQEASSQESISVVQDSCPSPTVSTKPILQKVPISPHIPRTAKPSFVCSSLTPNLVSQVEKLAKIVGGEFSTKFSAHTTHLIVRVDGENRADKTLKYLSALAAGKWVVSFQWVQKCLEAGKLIPEKSFEALDASGEPGPRRSRESHESGNKLFQNFEFCCIGDFPDLSKNQLEALLIDCGASIVNSPTEFSFRDNVVPLALAQYDEDQEQEHFTWLDRYSAPLIQHEWVLECIGKYCVTSFAPTLLCETTDDVLLSMGIPGYLFESIDSEKSD